LKKSEDLPSDFQELLNMISCTYDRYQKDGKELKRSTPKSAQKILFLKRAERGLKTLFDNTGEAFFSVDMELRQIICITPACEKIYGYSPRYFLNNPDLWYELIVDEDKEIIHKNHAVLAAGKTLIQEYRVRHKNGDVKWLQSKLQPTLNDKGKLVRIDGFTTDITARKKAEIALRNNEYKLRSLIINSSDAITITNEEFELIFVSDSWYRITGYTEEESYSLGRFQIVHPDDRNEQEAFLNTVLQTHNEVKGITVRLKKKDGSYIWVERLAVNLIGDHIVRGIISNFRDVTERKQYIEALSSSNEQLKKINSELDRFVYSVSHDLRAPLLSILGLIEISTTEDSELKENLALMKASVQKLDSFILEILNYSKNSRLEIKNEKIQLRTFLHEIVENLKFINLQNNNRVRVKIAVPGGIEFYTDKARLSMILNNLIANGIQYSNPEAQNPFVKISINGNEQEVELTVSDNGIGIKEEYHKKIFDMFYRISKNSVGSGLGLYIVKEAVEKLNGIISVQSEQARGTKFIISLPNKIS